MKTKIYSYREKFVVCGDSEWEFSKLVPSYEDGETTRNEKEMIAYLIKHWGGEQEDYEIINAY